MVSPPSALVALIIIFCVFGIIIALVKCDMIVFIRAIVLATLGTIFLAMILSWGESFIRIGAIRRVYNVAFIGVALLYGLLCIMSVMEESIRTSSQSFIGACVMLGLAGWMAYYGHSPLSLSFICGIAGVMYTVYAGIFAYRWTPSATFFQKILTFLLFPALVWLGPFTQK